MESNAFLLVPPTKSINTHQLVYFGFFCWMGHYKLSATNDLCYHQSTQPVGWRPVPDMAHERVGTTKYTNDSCFVVFCFIGGFYTCPSGFHHWHWGEHLTMLIGYHKLKEFWEWMNLLVDMQCRWCKSIVYISLNISCISLWSCIEIAADHFSKGITICETSTGTYIMYKCVKK